MKSFYRYRTTLFLLTALLFFAGIVVPVMGQSAPVVAAVQPGQVTNGGESRLVVSGSGFGAGAVVSLSGGLALNTVVESDARLTALLPARTLAGVYDVQVANGDGGRSTLPQSLVIIGPTSVQPGNVSNVAAAELVITGLGFSEGAIVVVDNYGALETTFVSSNLLRAILPAGLAPGSYTVRVVNPDASSSVLPNALTVTAVPGPTSTPAPTAFVRPVLVVQSYGASSAEITAGQDLDFEMTLANNGQSAATNIVANFGSGDFMPRATGGVYAVGTLQVGEGSRFWQPLTASRDLAGQGTGVLEVRVSYTDPNGTAYSETFSLTFPVVRQAGAGVAPTPTMTPTPTPTATPAPRLRPQLLVSSYESDVAQLEPGSRFRLSLNVQNQGNADARRITMILGGGSMAGGTAPGSTPEAGGVNGAGGEFSNFAPVGASNISFLGDLNVGGSLTGHMDLIVNSSTKPGAYPVVVSFAYNDAAGGGFMDEQVITLLVFSPPAAEMNFYIEPAPLMVGQPGPLPLQLVNMGRSSAVFGTFSVAATGVQFMNNNVFIGALEPGGSYPVDVMVIPEQPGPLELTVRVGYTDDFNQPQVLTKTLTVEVMEAPPMEEMPPEGEGGMGMPPVEPLPAETLGQKVWRFVLGMVGLSSGRPDPALAGMPPMDMPPPDMGGVPPYQQ